MSTPHYSDDRVTLHHGDCLDVMRAMPDASVDAIVTDPPYGLGFMGREWDDLPPGLPWARECLRVLKPGGHLLAFGGSRTWHRLAVAVEDAGFEVRDSIAWLYGSGFPKSLDVGKAIDRSAGAEREVVGSKAGLPGYSLAPDLGRGVYSANGRSSEVECAVTAPATDAARQWDGWGTALKPAFEPIVVGRKPLAGTVAANVQQHGTGALNIGACRVGTSGGRTVHTKYNGGDGWSANTWTGEVTDNGGRWPTNVVLDGSQADELDAQSGDRPPGGSIRTTVTTTGDSGIYGKFGATVPREARTDTGGASRFFPTFRYEAKAPTAERPTVDGVAHPTVKPLALMRWLVRLVTPPGGLVLDTFAGSGTTGEACVYEHLLCVLIEREAAYLPLIVDRLRKPAQVGFDYDGGAAA